VTSTREMSRAEARVRRTLFKSRSERKAQQSREQAARALDRIRCTIADPEFVRLIRAAGVTTVPKRLLVSRSSPSEDLRIIDCTLDFAVAWTFLYPLFKDPSISEELDRHWPGLVPQVKDAFIGLAVDGPFPD
jgi:hypothetical protein